MSKPVQPFEVRPLTEGETFWLFIRLAINDVYTVRGEELKAMCETESHKSNSNTGRT